MPARQFARRLRVAPPAVLLAALVAMAAAAPGSTAQEPLLHPLTFGDRVKLPKSDDSDPIIDLDFIDHTCTGPCGEPLMAVAPDGDVWVTAPRALFVCCNVKSSPLWVSRDGGRTWRDPIHPNPLRQVPYSPSNAFTGGDTTLAIDDDGTLYLQELWLGNDTIFISEDEGQTWITSPIHHPDTFIDRPWMEYSRHHDAVFTNYSGYNGLWLARADVGGPAGPSSALFFADARMYATGSQACVPVPERICLYDDILGFPGLAENPPARPAIDQSDGTIYVPFSYYYQGQGVRVAVSEDGGDTFRYATVPGSGMTEDEFGRAFTTMNFVVAAVDAAGNAYLSWVEQDEEGEFVIAFSSSIDRGRTWRPPQIVSKEISETVVFPTIAAGADSRVALAWFGTSDFRGDPNDAPAATSWEIDVAVTLDAHGDDPNFEIARLDPGFHRGSIWTISKGSGDRRLLDFFDMRVEPSTGALLIVYARDKGERTELAFIRQTDGCSMTRPGEFIGPGVPAPPGAEPTAC